jgi:heme/copper-type cytochrome/quinol oxidase subunit 1
MLSVGKLFAVAAILALIVGFISWPQPETGFYTITFRNRSYGFGSDYWAFSIGAIFAVLAASYRWLPSVFSLQLNGLVTHLHFWLSAISAFAFLLVVPGWQAFASSRATALSGEQGSIAQFLVLTVATMLFLFAQVLFVGGCIWGILYSRNV